MRNFSDKKSLEIGGSGVDKGDVFGRIKKRLRLHEDRKEEEEK